MTKHRGKTPSDENPMPDSDRGRALGAIPMPELAPEERIRNFSEVSLGYTATMAIAEAARCHQCEHSEAHCLASCPLGVDVPKFIGEIAAGNFTAAFHTLSDANPLPGVCGRICPQESLCRSECPAGSEGEAICIGHLERFIGDWQRNLKESMISGPTCEAIHKVAILGSGPAGLACAAALARRQHDVTVLDTSSEVGGILAHGIPEFRLPREVLVSEIDNIRLLGVKFVSLEAGASYRIERLLGPEGYQAAFIGTDDLSPMNLNIPGQTLKGVFNGRDFLKLAHRMQGGGGSHSMADPVGFEHVVVAGGGNAALDCARSAVRMGAKEVTVVYWRSLHELPARPPDVEHARQEGIQFLLLATPVRLLGSEEHRLRRVECLETELDEPDASGRARPHPKTGSEFQLAADTFVVAVGQRPAPTPVRPIAGLEFDSDGCLRCDPETYRTGIPGVFAGGTMRNGATMPSAMRAGQGAARAIHHYLLQDPNPGIRAAIANEHETCP